MLFLEETLTRNQIEGSVSNLQRTDELLLRTENVFMAIPITLSGGKALPPKFLKPNEYIEGNSFFFLITEEHTKFFYLSWRMIPFPTSYGIRSFKS